MINRRDILKYGAAGFVSGGAGFLSSEAVAQAMCKVCVVGPSSAVINAIFDLEIGDLKVRLVDGERVNMLAFRLASADQTFRVPGPLLRVREGSMVQVKITNTRKETHGFEITGIPQTKTEIEPGCSCTVRFTAPDAGTYIYHDAYGGTPLYRILGLHGVLVVEPLNGRTAVTASNAIPSATPYSLDKLGPGQRDVITKLFNALGTTERFQGGADGKWVPAGSDEEFSNQEKIWVLSEVDPKFNALITPGIPIRSNPSLTSDVVRNYVPRYFTINNRSGFDLHSGDDVIAANYIGEPTLIRVLNVGLAHHGPHIHGNHVMRLSQANLDPGSPDFGRVEVSSNIFEVDTWAVWPMDRREVLLPFEIPPDIPYRIPIDSPTPGITQFERMVKGQTQEPFPLRYVMHDHVEMSQTAAGGNYPQGMATHWEILGGLGGRPKTSVIARAPLAVAPASAATRSSAQVPLPVSEQAR